MSVDKCGLFQMNIKYRQIRTKAYPAVLAKIPFQDRKWSGLEAAVADAKICGLELKML